MGLVLLLLGMVQLTSQSSSSFFPSLLPLSLYSIIIHVNYLYVEEDVMLYIITLHLCFTHVIHLLSVDHTYE